MRELEPNEQCSVNDCRVTADVMAQPKGLTLSYPMCWYHATTLGESKTDHAIRTERPVPPKRRKVYNDPERRREYSRRYAKLFKQYGPREYWPEGVTVWTMDEAS